MNVKRGLYWAKLASKFSDFPRYKIGCVLIYHNYVLGNGWNSKSTHPCQKKYNKERNLIGDHIKHCMHSEIMAIEGAKHYEVNWKKVTIYIYRAYRNGKPALANPVLLVCS